MSIVGVDLGKNSCSVVDVDAAGAVVMRRQTLIDYVLKLPTCVLRCSPSGSPAQREGTRDPVDVARICSPLRQSAEER